MSLREQRRRVQEKGATASEYLLTAIPQNTLSKGQIPDSRSLFERDKCMRMFDECLCVGEVDVRGGPFRIDDFKQGRTPLW